MTIIFTHFKLWVAVGTQLQVGADLNKFTAVGKRLMSLHRKWLFNLLKSIKTLAT